MATSRRSAIRRPTALLAVLALSALVIGCSPASGPLGTPSTPAPTSEASVAAPSGDLAPGPSGPASPSPSGTPSPAATSAAPSPVPSGAPPASPAGSTLVRAYFLLTSPTGGGLVPVLREVAQTQAVATAAMHGLLAGPTPAERGASPAVSTSVPDGTRLLGLSISNRVATVNLSAEFASGGGSASMFGRLAQVVYTVTQFSTVDSVLLKLDGQPVTTFSGEGIVLDRALGRADFRDQLPAIFVDRPAWGAGAGSPARVSGVANVFEADFRVQVRDASGTLIADRQVMASCGTGCWGDFSASLAYSVARAQWGTLRVFDSSAKDGAPENVTEYPVWLTPAG